MADFIGTKKEFNRFFGPHLRNLVQHLTRKYRREIGKCEHCSSEKNLESAHKKGKERTEIIDEILKDFYSVNNYRVDLIKFEEKFKKRHENLQEVIMILCRDCHYKYDNPNTLSNTSLRNSKDIKSPSRDRIYTNREIQELIFEKLNQLEPFELDKFCDKDYSKTIFDINFSLLRKIHRDSSLEKKKELIINNGLNRWTWKFTIEKGNYIYALCTQWYDRNDIYVKKWLTER